MSSSQSSNHYMTPLLNYSTAPRAWFALALILAVTAGLRTRLLDVPLERDEGEYAYAGQLMLQGVPPYKHVYTMKWPGTFTAYAAIMSVFGETTRGIHTGLIIVNGMSIVLVFLIGRRLLSDTGAVAVAAFYAMLSLSRRMEGFTANCEHFVLVPALAGIWLLLRALAQAPEARLYEKAGLLDPVHRNLIVSGLLLGSAPLFKQHGAMFLFFGACYLIYREYQTDHNLKSGLPRLALFATAALIPFVVTCLILTSAGSFDKFWLWTIQYPRSYVAQVPLGLVPKLFWDMVSLILRVTWPIAVLAVIGGVTLSQNKTTRELRTFVFGLALFGFLAVCPGFYFRLHYFQFVLPAVALLATLGVERICEQWNRRWVRFAAVLAPVALIAVQERDYLFRMTPAQISQNVFVMNGFPESVVIAERIARVTTPQQKIAVIGSEPQIYFYSRRRAATEYIYMYPLMENHSLAEDMQEEFIRDVETAAPDYVVFVGLTSSWARLPSSRSLVFDWANAYLARDFVMDGLVELDPEGETQYQWGERDLSGAPWNQYRILLFKRKGREFVKP